MTRTQTRPWNAADFLETEEDVVAYLEAVFDDGDPELIAAALDDIAKAAVHSGFVSTSSTN